MNPMHAQTELILTDQSTGEGVSDVLAEVVDASRSKSFHTTDRDGLLEIDDAKLPIEVTFHHLSYKTKEVEVTSSNPIVIQLERIVHQIEDVVVTGQYFAQSSGNSVYRVESIDRTEMAGMAGANLAEIMSFRLNTKVERDQNLNGSSVSLLGLGGNNVKVLLDGMPLAGRTALEFDLSQINLSNVERIEIVEGPMSVEYGSNALAGVINIISKKAELDQSTLCLKLQEESIGSAYGFKQGTHNIAASYLTPLLKNMTASVNAEHRYFGGVENEDMRSTNWDPKRQLFLDATISTQLDRAQLSYRSSYYRDWIDNLGNAQGPLQNRGRDDYYQARRWSHHLSYGKYFDRLGRVDAKVSYSEFKRTKNTYITDLMTEDQKLSLAEGAQDTSIFKNASVWLHHTFIASPTFQMKTGVDAQYDFTDGGRIAGGVGQSAYDIAIFSTAEWKVANSLTIKPGLRWSYNSRFKAPVIPSLHTQFNISDGSNIRAGYARGFRAPGLRELYFEFVDNSHTIFGNPNLTSETSDYVEVSYENIINDNKLRRKFDTRFYYTHVKNQITFAQDISNPARTTLLNIADYKAYGLNMRQSIEAHSFEVALGAGFLAAYSDIDHSAGSGQFLYSPEVTLSLRKSLGRTPLSIMTQVKYNGEVPSFINENTGPNGEPETRLIRSDDFVMMDIIASYEFSDRLNIQGGIKNLFDINDVNVGVQGQFHKSEAELPIGYGRSGFIRLNYLMNTKH